MWSLRRVAGAHLDDDELCGVQRALVEGEPHVESGKPVAHEAQDAER